MALIWIEPDRMGGVTLGFVCKRTARRVVAAMACQTADQRAEWLRCGAYIQEHQVAESFAGLIPPRVLRDVLSGYNARVRIDAWTAAHFYGWDAHTAFEGARS